MPGTLVISDLSDGTNSTSATNLVRGPCVAWVNFNGTGTPAIRASYNVSSITDNGTGDYTVNFTNVLPDANYSIVGTADTTSFVNRSVAVWSGTNQTASLVRVGTLATNGTGFDANYVSVAVFR
jgi:hypothetical protein